MNRKYVTGGLSKLFSSKKSEELDTSLFVSPPEVQFEPSELENVVAVEKKRSKKRKNTDSETVKDTQPIIPEVEPSSKKKKKAKKQQKLPDVNISQTEELATDVIKKKSKISNKDQKNVLPPGLQPDPLQVEKQPDDPEKLARTLFVGNLPINYGKKQIKSLFSKYSKVESLRIRSAVPGKPKLTKKIAVITKTFHQDRESVNAYVVLKSREKAEEALELNGLAIEGNHIRVDWADNKEHDHSRSIFVGNLPFGLEDDELRTFFNECGKVESIRIIRDKATGAGKGFGYVLFKSESSIPLALKKNEEELAGRNIRVFRARKEKVKHAQRKSRQTEDENNGETNSERKIKQPKWLRKSNTNSGGIRSYEGVRSVEDVKERVKIQRNIKVSAHKNNKKLAQANPNLSKKPKKKMKK